jgi:glycosyltransferase involved in cell wall biosynthesis
MSFSKTHLLLLPTFDTGPRLIEVVKDALAQWQPVLVVDDGSVDESVEPVRALASTNPGLSVLTLPRNQGKGAAVLAGAAAALQKGYTHALVMDADGQHPSAHIGRFMAASAADPSAMILGVPQFGAEAPAIRVQGRKLSQAMVRLETLGPAIGDPLFGFRVYPLGPLVAVLGVGAGGRGYDFDTEAAVRLFWAGVKPVNLDAPVQYFSREEGGVSHFHYLRDNAVLFGMHVRLVAELLIRRLPSTLRHRRRLKAAGLTALAVALALAPSTRAAELPPEIAEGAHAIEVSHLDPFWLGLALSLESRPSVYSTFTEDRYFPFHKKTAELKGEVRIDPRRGLSLHYTQPTERIVVMDDQGVLLRENGRDSTPPAGAKGPTDAMLGVLRLDFASLAQHYSLYGVHGGGSWELELSSDGTAGAPGRVYVLGMGGVVTRIILRESEKQRIDIVIDPPHEPAPFSAAILRRYFR